MDNIPAYTRYKPTRIRQTHLYLSLMVYIIIGDVYFGLDHIKKRTKVKSMLRNPKSE